MRECFLISKVISITLHRQTESFSENIVSCSRSFFSSFYIQLISFITHRLAKIRISLDPHFWITNFIDGIQFIPPDRHMRIDVITLEDVHQLHFDCIAASITNSTLRANSYNDVIVNFRSTLLDCTDNIFSNVARKPFVHSCNFDLQTLKLVDAHRSDFKQRTGQEILYTFLSRSQLCTVCFGAGSIL